MPKGMWKKMKNKTKIIAVIIAIIIIAGIIVTLTVGLNFDLRYQEAKKVELYIAQEFEISDIKSITDEVLPNQKVIIQKVEVYEDSVSIISKDITDEQKTQLVEKINEKYGTELSADSIETVTIPHTRGRDIIKPYILPLIISTVIILVYMAIRYHKLGVIKVLLKTIFATVVVELILLSLIAICRIPVGRLTILMVLTVYLLTLVGITTRFEKQLKNKKGEE